MARRPTDGGQPQSWVALAVSTFVLAVGAAVFWFYLSLLEAVSDEPEDPSSWYPRWGFLLPPIGLALIVGTSYGTRSVRHVLVVGILVWLMDIVLLLAR